MRKFFYLFLMVVGLTGCDDPCSPEKAAEFYIAYHIEMYNDIDMRNYSLKYIIKNFVAEVKNTGLIDKRYGTPICRVKFKNHLYNPNLAFDNMPEYSHGCFTYIPRTNGFVQISGIEKCCSYYTAIPEFCYF